MKMKVIAQILYYFNDNKIVEKNFLRYVDIETEKTYQVYQTGEGFKKSHENKPTILNSYGCVSLWKARELDAVTDYDMDAIRHEMVAELKEDLIKYLLSRIIEL